MGGARRRAQQGEERRPTTPDRIVELSIGVGARPVEVHVGGCYAARKRHRAITRGQALAAFEHRRAVPWLDLTTWPHRQQQDRCPIPRAAALAMLPLRTR
ncbi:DUF6233 domain-containing protein [Streptomyces sp. NBC_01727]|uniref:DUF6233 domain-containing protein n=1 Tax=unclassified Streptomyces TaxID=2593676 RepID=UPI002E127CE3|nr:DUF6233 domain-containing protein [Streptomyces sp. NBC_01727]